MGPDYTGQGKSRFTVVINETQDLFLHYYLLIIILCSMQKIVNLLSLHPVFP